MNFLRNIKRKLIQNKEKGNLKTFFSSIEQSKILFVGYPKSGNTWSRFLIYNYLMLLNDNNHNTPLDYVKLNSIQNNVLENNTTNTPEENFPLFYRLHYGYDSFFELFDKVIFIHRNPLDTLISAYHFYKNRETSFPYDNKEVREQLHDIDFYIQYKIDDWIKYFELKKENSTIELNYSLLKTEPEKELNKLFTHLEWPIHDELIQKTIKLSSFDTINKISKEKDQQNGMAPKDGFKGVFTRSGEEKQYEKILKKSTIEFVKTKFPQFDELYN